MKNFTIKDLMKYNNPCKSCGASTTFRLLGYTDDGQVPSTIIPTYHDGFISLTLSYQYKNYLEMIVNPVTNSFIVTSESDAEKFFEEFLSKTNLVTSSQCTKCGTAVTSNYLEFDKGKIKPATLFTETVNIYSAKYQYTISTNFENNKSHISVVILDQVSPLTPLTLDVPAIPLAKFKDRADLIKKMRLMVTFS